MSEFSLHLDTPPAPPCSPETTIPQIFAVMRQWIPSIQHNMASLTREVLKRGAHVNDRDSLSDLTLLHYAVKSGAGDGGLCCAKLSNQSKPVRPPYLTALL